MSWNMKAKSLLDRRTLVTILVCTGLFVLAINEIKAEVAIESMTFLAVALIAGNASQRSLIAWAGRAKLKKTTSTKLKEKKDGTSTEET